jgi:Spy/CpxP family protein refolding chaperone
MRNYLPWIALGLSLTLNVVMVVDQRFGEAPPPPKVNAERQLADEMHLTEAQLESYQFYRQQLRDMTGATRLENQDDIEAYYEELAAPNPDIQKLDALLQQINHRRAHLQVSQTAATVKFMTVLDPNQREILLDATRRQQEKGNLRPRRPKPEQDIKR